MLPGVKTIHVGPAWDDDRMEWFDLLPLIAATLTGIVAIAGVWWSIAAANSRETERGKRDRLTVAAANFLEKSREVTDQVYLYIQSLNELGSVTPKNATEIVIRPPSRFPAYRRLAALQGALDQLIVVCPEPLYDHAANILSEHTETVLKLNEFDRNNRFDGEFNLIWYDAENPGEPMQTQISKLAAHNEAVGALSRHFATQVRAELGLPPINPTSDRTRAQAEPSVVTLEDNDGTETPGQTGSCE